MDQHNELERVPEPTALMSTTETVVRCTACGAGASDSWAFCRACGSALTPRPQEAAAVQVVDVQEPKSRFTRRRVLSALAIVAIAGTILGLTLNTIGTHSRLSDTRTRLATTTGKLKETKSSLASRTKERDDLTSKLNGKELELTGVRGSLTDAQSRIGSQANQIDNLKTCLDGVMIALRDAAYGDYSGAVSALQAVNSACEVAQSAL